MPPAGKLLQGPEAVYVREAAPFLCQAGLVYQIHPPELPPEMCLEISRSAERGGWIFRLIVLFFF